jgi:RimJ/RimL family protein N-acetyltransferase
VFRNLGKIDIILTNLKSLHKKIICETPRLILREINQDDDDHLFEILGDPEVMQFAVIEKGSGKFVGRCGTPV